jgi:hypothetical protein
LRRLKMRCNLPPTEWTAKTLLFLILTSQGSQAGVAVQAGRREEILSPASLSRILGRTGVQCRIVIISACYSGVFVGLLANDNTLSR